MSNAENVIIENAQLAFKNFSGKGGEFNREGDRNFCILLDDDIAEDLTKNGWNVKFLKPREDGDNPRPYIQVKVKFDDRFPMNVVIISSNGKTRLNEDTINTLDWAEIDTTDLVIRPYDWEVSGKNGRAAYLKTLYATIVEDEIAKKYENPPDSAESCIGGCGNCEECDGSCHAN